MPCHNRQEWFLFSNLHDSVQSSVIDSEEMLSEYDFAGGVHGKHYRAF